MQIFDRFYIVSGIVVTYNVIWTLYFDAKLNDFLLNIFPIFDSVAEDAKFYRFLQVSWLAVSSLFFIYFYFVKYFNDKYISLSRDVIGQWEHIKNINKMIIYFSRAKKK